MSKMINIELSDLEPLVDMLRGGTIIVEVDADTSVSLKLKKEELPEDDEEACDIIESLWDKF